MDSTSCSIEQCSADSRFARAEAPSGHEPHRVPTIDRDGQLRIDPWWGSIQPASLHPRIPTWGERELIEHLESGGLVVDTRRPEYVAESGTIPGAVPVPWEEITEHLELFDSGIVAVFCNGPQCAATPRAVERLLEAGVPPERLAYYRGGLQDWMGLGLPVSAAEIESGAR